MSPLLVFVTVVLVVLFLLGVAHDLRRNHLRGQAGRRRPGAGAGY